LPNIFNNSVLPNIFNNSVWVVINTEVINKFIEQIKSKFKELSQEVLEFFDSIKIAVIKHQLILDDNKVN
jgi:hypothetical protein